MNIFGRIKQRLVKSKLREVKERSANLIEDLNSRIKNQQVETPPPEKSVSRVPVKVIPFKPVKKKNGSRDRELMFDGTYLNRYNFGDLYATYTKETYFKIAVDKYVEGVVKRGFHYASKTQLVIEYLRKRTRELSITSKKDANSIVRDLTFSLVMFGNAFKVKTRDSNRSSGMSHVWQGRTVKPIAGWYVADPRRMLIHVGESGRLKYVIMPTKVKSLRVSAVHALSFIRNLPSSIYGAIFSGYSTTQKLVGINLLKKSKDVIVLDEEDVEHIRYHHTPGEKWAMPPFYPVLEDINLLRSTETAVDLLIYQFGSLLIHVKVSNPLQNIVNAVMKRPANDDDINEVRNKLNKMEPNGFIVTGDHVEMEVLQVAGNILRLEDYLRYFKQRTFSGLWLSPVVVGESSEGIARSVADTIMDEKTGKIIELQSIISEAMDNLAVELLLEAGLSYGQVLRSDVVAHLVFDDVDVELKLKKRNSTIQLYEVGLLTEQEARKEIGMDDLTDEERGYTFPRLVKEYLIRVEQEAKAGALIAGLAARSAGSKRAKAKPTAATRKSENTIVPQNKSGKKLNSKKPVNPK